MNKLYVFIFTIWGIIINAQTPNLSWKSIEPTRPPGFTYSPLYALGKNDLIWMAFSDGAVPFNTPTGCSFSISTNGGDSWSTKGYFPYNLISPSQDNITFRGFKALSANSALFLWAVDNTHAKVFKTKDGGTTWQKTGEFDTYPHSIHFFDDNNGVVVCREDASKKFKVYRTTNGGDSWQQLDPAGIPLTVGYETTIFSWTHFSGSKDAFWIGTTNGRIFMTKDKGLTWSLISTPYPAGADYGSSVESLGTMAVDDQNPDLGYILGLKTGKIHRTTDGGTTWTPLGFTETGTSDYNIVKVPNTDFLIATGQKTRYSTNKGETWTDIDNIAKFGPNSTGANCTFTTLSSSFGFFFKLMGLTGKTPVEDDVTVETPDEEFAIYPIPTGNYLYIRSKILIDHYTIWDSAGRLIQQGKTDDNRIDVAWFSKGTYHIEIVHNGNTIVKKFIKK